MHLYGDSPLVRSAFMTDKIYKNISDLSEDRAGQTLWIRGRLATSRAVGKGIFLVLRQSLDTVQAGKAKAIRLIRPIGPVECSPSLPSSVSLIPLCIETSPIILTNSLWCYFAKSGADNIFF